MRLWPRKHAPEIADATEADGASRTKLRMSRKPAAGVAGGWGISTEEGVEHPLAPRMKPKKDVIGHESE